MALNVRVPGYQKLQMAA